MKLGIAAQNGRKFVAAQKDQSVYDLSTVAGTLDLREIISGWNALKANFESSITNAPAIDGAAVRWQSPLPNPPKFLLVAANYRAHIVEVGFAPVFEGVLTPQFFMKPNTTIIGPEDDIPLVSNNIGLDYEAELAVVIGKTCSHASLEEASAAVWGYTVVNDVSERKLNKNLEGRSLRQNDDFYDWLVGKWFDKATPVGPWVVTADEIEKVDDLMIRSRLNGKTVQEAPASAMIHNISQLIQYISNVVTLEPGDVIATGTPAGVGMATGRLLQDGDLIECEIDQIGTLKNRVRAV